MSYLDELNSKQREAVLDTEGQLLILAGAGSGKTRVLTTKIAYLLDENKADSSDILAITFTNKAAGEMKERLASIIGEKTVEPMWVGTFHAICGRILRREIHRLGYTSQFTVYDRTDQKQLIKEIVRELGWKSKDISLNTVLSVVSKEKNRGVTPEEYAAQDHYYEFPQQVEEIYPLYEKRKKINNAVDFDDMLLLTVKLLKEFPEVAGKYGNKFKYILVDEYQDTNRVQYELIHELSRVHENVCVVGDVDQSIYGFRGADIQNILDFQKDFPQAKIIKLEENYRSTKQILDVANKVIANNEERIEKNLWTNNEDGKSVIYKQCFSDDEEAYQVVHWIEKESEQYSFDQMAILYRTNAQSRLFEDALMRKGIDYRVVGGLKFYERKEIKDLIAYLQVLANPRDDISLKRIINSPKRGIGEVTLGKMENYGRTHATSIYPLLPLAKERKIVNAGTAGKLENFYQMMEDLKEKVDEIPLTELVKEMIRSTGYTDSLVHSEAIEDKSRLENIDSYISSVASFEERFPEATLAEYLNTISLYSDSDKTENKPGVNLLTIHSAKGLEFDVVFLTGMEEGVFPSRQATTDHDHEEERRLCYVAITRAGKKLYLTSASNRRIYGAYEPHYPSRFIEEMGDKLTKQKDSAKETQSIQRNTYGRKNQEALLESVQYQDAFFEVPKPKKSQREDIGNVKEGDKIKHSMFGIGTVVAIKGDLLTVSFDGKGLKRMKKDIPQIERV